MVTCIGMQPPPSYRNWTLFIMHPLHFITNSKSLTHHCTLYQMVGWASLYMLRKIHLYVFIYKALLCKLPLYLCSLVSFTTSSYHTRSARWLLLKVHRSFTVLGKTAFSSCARVAWNSLESILHLDILLPLNEFKILMLRRRISAFFRLDHVVLSCCMFLIM